MMDLTDGWMDRWMGRRTDELIDSMSDGGGLKKRKKTFLENHRTLKSIKS